MSLRQLKKSGHALKYADESFKKDKSIVLAAVKENGLVFEDVDESLQKDPDVIKAANKKVLCQILKANLKVFILLKKLKKTGDLINIFPKSYKKS